MTVARLFQHAPKPRDAAVQAKVHTTKVARSLRSARDPRFMRTVDRLQNTAARALRTGPGEKVVNASPIEPMPSLRREPDDARFSAMLDLKLQAMRVSAPHDPSEREAEATAGKVARMAHP